MVDDSTVPIAPTDAPPAWAAHLRFLLPADAATAVALEPPTDEEPRLAPPALVAALRSGANDRFTDLVVVGWSAGAFELVRQDSVLRDKRILWAVPSGCLRWLARDALALGQGVDLRVAICDDRAQLPYLLEHVPVCWSLAILDERLFPAGEVVILGRTRFQRGHGSMARIHGDMLHLWGRLDRLPEAIPLSAWRRRWAGRTALCLAAGPSLDTHLDFIRAHMDRCVVIVVDVLQSRLQERGIKVDFVLTVDSDERLNQRLVPPADPATTMIMPLLGNRALDEKFPHRSYFGHGALARWLLGETYGFQTGTTVGIATVGFADFLGCDEAILIGHDLAYSDEAYYSDLVAGKDEHQAAMKAESDLMRRRVAGNSGDDVVTDYLFEVGIQDLGLLLRSRPALTAYNLNINHRVGARIPGTKPLPEGWTPRGDGAVERPSSDARLRDVIAPDLRTLVPAKLAEQSDYLVQQWRAYVAEGLNSVMIEERLRAHPWSAMAAGVMHHAYMGAVLMLMQLLSLPPSIGAAWQRAETERFILDSLEGARTWFRRLLSDDPPKLHDKPADGREERRRFLAALLSSLGEPTDSPADAILLPTTGKYLRNLAGMLPDLDFTTPSSAHAGLHIIRNAGELVPDRFIRRTLYLCALEEVPEPLAWAGRTGYLAERDLPSSAPRRAPEDPELAAVEAVLRLRAGTSTSAKADAVTAARWRPCHVALVRALLARGDDGMGQVEKLVRRGDLEIDDQLYALVLLHAPDYQRACVLLQPFNAAIGEASVLAMAKRRLDLGDRASARRFAGSVRRLSRFRDEALVLLCEAAEPGAAGAAEIAAHAQEMLDPDVRARWSLASAERGGGGYEAFMRGVVDGVLMPPPDVLARLAQAAWRARSADHLSALYELLLERPRDRGQAPYADEYRELLTAVTAMLGGLGYDVAPLHREVVERMTARG